MSIFFSKFSKSIVLMLLSSCLLALAGFLVAASADAAAVSWDGGGDGTTWESANNWNPNGVPASGDDVTIDANVTLTISATDTVGSLTLGNSGGTTTPTLQFNYAAIAGTAVTVTNDLIMYSGSTINHTDNTTTQAYDIDLSVGGGMTISSGASIDLDGKGYTGGTANSDNGDGTGAGTYVSYTGGGGAHGNDGGKGSQNSTENGGTVYGSALNPVTIGSGGASGYGTGVDGGDGGGGVRLDVTGTLTVNGIVTADAVDGGDNLTTNSGGGGAGGGINIVAGTFAGSGTIGADGGDGGNGAQRDAGGGAGGRIFVRYATLSGIADPQTTFKTMFSVTGGSVDNTHSMNPSILAVGDLNGTAIIVDTDTDTSTFTDADIYIVDGFEFQSGDEQGTSPTRFLYNDIYAVGSSSSGTGLVQLRSDTSASIVDADGTLTLSNASWACSGVTTLQIDADVLNIGGDAGGDSEVTSFGGTCVDITLNVQTTQQAIVDGLSVTTGLFDWNMPASTTLTLSDSTITTTTETQSGFTIDDAITLNLGTADSSNATIITSNTVLDITAMTIYSGSSLSANGLGCKYNSVDDGDGPNVSEVCTIRTTGYGDMGSYAGGGAGHGGLGGTTVDSAAAGAIYDTAATPSTYSIGSSGARGQGVHGGDGGGYIKIDASSALTLNGAVTADGTAGGDVSTNGAGGGSGGSIWIITGSLAGTASAGAALSADGGDGGDAGGGGRGGGAGGGGLIYLNYATDDSSYAASTSDANSATGGTGGTGGLGAGGTGGNGVITQNDRVPTHVSSVYKDNNGDGAVDQVVLTFSETVTLGGTVASARFTLVSSSGANGFGGSLSGNASVSGTDVTVTIGSAESNETGHATIPTIAYNDNGNDATNKIQDAGGGIVQTFSAQNVTDNAAPLLVSSSPEDSDVSIATNSTVVLTFTESIITGSFTYTCCGAGTDPGRSGAWTSGDTVYTITPTVNWTNSEIITINITAAPDTGSIAFAGAVSGSADPFSFTIASAPSGGTPTPGAGAPSTVTSSMVITPNGGEILAGLSVYSIKWLASGDKLDTVAIYYSLDGGKTYELLAGSEENDGSYLWTVPNSETTSGKIRVDAVTSTGGVLIDDASNASFTITLSTSVPIPEIAEPDMDGPVIAELMKPDGEVFEVREGSLFRGVELSGVYYVKDGTRYVFPSEDVFMSHYQNFDSVQHVDDDQLRKIPFGGRMIMAQGNLIKIQSDNRVYVVQADGVLAHIPDEATAIDTYGRDWAKLVRDVSVVFWFDYSGV